MVASFSMSNNYTVDHAYDDEVEKDSTNGDKDSISTISGKLDSHKNADDSSSISETPEEMALRYRSHLITYTTVCVMTIGFSVVLSGVWPYLHEMDPDKDQALLGWVVAANPFGQLIASPFVGYLANRLGGIREICYGTLTIFTLGNLLYGFLPKMNWSDNSIFAMMIVARFLVGLSSSNVTLCRSYMASSTTMQERTTKIAILSAAQSSGFILGPLLQTIFTASIDGVKKYQAAGWFAASLGILNFILLTPWVFKNFKLIRCSKFPNAKFQTERKCAVLFQPTLVSDCLSPDLDTWINGWNDFT